MSGDDVARLIYLGLLLVFLLGAFALLRGGGRRRSLFSEGGQKSSPLKAVLVWGLLFAGLIIVYGQRDVLMRELFPRQARQLDQSTIALNRTPGGAFITQAEVNGTQLTFLVDTGATDVVLTQRDAVRAGLHPDALVFDGIATTANGTVRTAQVTLDEVKFAGRVDENVPASVNEGELGVSLLGMSYLNQFERIEISGDRMLLIGR